MIKQGNVSSDGTYSIQGIAIGEAKAAVKQHQSQEFRLPNQASREQTGTEAAARSQGLVPHPREI
jgi:hypothetical protein